MPAALENISLRGALLTQSAGPEEQLGVAQRFAMLELEGIDARLQAFAESDLRTVGGERQRHHECAVRCPFGDDVEFTG